MLNEAPDVRHAGGGHDPKELRQTRIALVVEHVQHLLLLHSEVGRGVEIDAEEWGHDEAALGVDALILVQH